MKKTIFLANAILSLPFGVIGLAAPGPLFANFGVSLDTGGQLIARGYAATLIGYGLLFFLLRNASDTPVVKALLIASVAFNLIEAIIQGVAGMNGVTTSIIWGNVVVHGIFAVLSALLVFRLPKENEVA